MNVAFFLTPKSESVWVPADATLCQVMEQMQACRHTAVPILDDEGHYLGTLTEGDVLFALRASVLPWRAAAETTHVGDVPRRMNNQPVHVDAEIEALVERTIVQSFVPVVDDRDVFVGIVRRAVIIGHLGRLAGLLGG